MSNEVERLSALGAGVLRNTALLTSLQAATDTHKNSASVSLLSCIASSTVSADPEGPARCSIGDNALLGDKRWGGLYGIDADFVAEENSKAVLILASDFQAAPGPSVPANRDHSLTQQSQPRKTTTRKYSLQP